MENYFSENLPILRRRAGYTQESLAGELGISRQSVGKWEKGQTLPEAGTLLTLADLLGCSLDTLMREKLTGEPASVPAKPEPTGAEGPAGETFPAVEAPLFDAYDTCMDRVAAMMGLGVGSGLAAVGNMMFLRALGASEGLSMGMMFLGVITAILLVVVAGVTDERFKTAYPAVPDLYTERERSNFQKIYDLGSKTAGAAALIDLVAVVFLGAFLSGHRRMTLVLVGIFLLVQALAAGTLTFLVCLSQKYKLGKESRPQALQELQENG